MFIPTKVESEENADSSFFPGVIHVMFNLLGISKNQFQNYHSYENSSKYSSIFCWLNISGKVMKFITTPYAHIFATKHFGTDTFVGDNGTCPSGIEIENSGGSGIAGSSLEGRVYMTDIMTGLSLQQGGQFNRLTDASMALLQDTGNYKVTWSMGQPLVWGNPESIDGNPIKDFAIGSPQKVFPSNYFLNFSAADQSYTGFDYKFYGYASYNNQWNCSDSSVSIYPKVKEYCTGKSFFNPNNEKYIGSLGEYDFMPIINPMYVCGTGKAVIPSTLESLDHCGEYKCNGYTSFTIKMPTDMAGGTKTITCNSSNVDVLISEKIYVTSNHTGSYYPLKYWCPPPERFCRSVKLHEMHFKSDPFLNSSVQFDNDEEEDIPSPTPYITATPVIRMKGRSNSPFL
ncbi:GP63-like [Trichomonas vaginalis G3]|uniref:GP63-like n=1 Tax=Trichomonas vaginalis (strain ATCC PRA-98 / G3) TaxID=412133 RepID=A2FJT5_TRIV3|nr:regulation of choline O-acetyltransferase protein [Trichomonas vaginalis G3]EAX94826.1 GP63-like [Trichomonas vaginalis G3]KAI5532166.1 regulation of choline O-acetyltransferase protein [Trichomonas vaginalis G3]|eukprot:XP_001307756.1 GP63-like [Trichomonas vaginalis G3]